MSFDKHTVNARPDHRTILRLTLALATVAVVALTIVAITYDISRHRKVEAMRLQTIADLKTRQVSDWLKDRQADVDYLRTDLTLARHYSRWSRHGDSAGRDQLRAHLEHFRASMGYQHAQLLDPNGVRLWDSAGAPATEVGSPVAKHPAVVSKPLGTLVPYRDASGAMYLDFMATLAVPDGPGPTIILSIDLAIYLFPLLKTWPLPSASAETLLFRRDGDQVQFLNDLRHQADAAVRLRVPLTTEKLLAAQVLRGEATQNRLLDGIDYRAAQVIGVVRAIPGTDWFLVAKLDRTEFFAEAWQDSRWIVLAGLLTLCMITAGALLLRQRQDLAEARSERERLAEHETIFNNALVGIVYLRRRRVVSCNRRFEELFGYGPNELIGESSERFYASRQTFDAIGKDAYRAGTKRRNFSTELVLKHKDGSLFHGALNGCVIDPAQPDEGSIWIYADITERKRAEDALRKSEALFQSVSQSANDAIITGDSSGKIVKWNRGAECIFGYLESEVIGQPLTLLMPPRFRQPHVDGMQRVGAGGEPRVMGKTVELFGVRKDGSEFPLELSLAQWQIPEGRFFTGVIRDITARRNVEQELADQREHLEALVEQRTIELSRALEVARLADQTKDAFLANMSHELRTPLNAVIGMTGLARTMSTDPRQRDYLDKVTSSGRHLNGIINDLLDFSKIAAGHLEFEAVSFSLSALLQRCHSVMSFRAVEKGLELVETVDVEVPDVLAGDPMRIEQIILNLVSNAIKFTPAGRVEILVSLHAREEIGVCLNIAVKDTGIGMSADDLGRLFKPFSQADASVSRKFGGTGLGLAISRRLAELMDGDISVSSIEGGGTTFTARIWLRMGRETDLPGSGPTADVALPARYQGARILAVDDQPLNREIVEALLIEVGIAPSMAENGQEALDILSEAGADAFDLVLMDIQMPVMDGHTATRALRRLPGFEVLPIIAMTAHTMAHEQQLDADAGMNDHIGKPFDNVGFYRTLAKWIPENKRKPTPAAEGSAAPSRSSNDAGNELDRLRGVDVAAALARFGGNEVRYRHWLAEFAATAAAVPDQMRGEIAAGRVDQAARTAHAFKGRVGMLGMTHLQSLVAELEPTLHVGAADDELLSRVDQSISQMREQLARMLGTGAMASALATDARDESPLDRVVWSEAYSVGVAEMDNQHKKLVEMINRLADSRAVRGDELAVAFHALLSDMFDYTQSHFKAEEDYLRSIGYPQLAAQQREHEAFVEKMAAFSVAAAEGSSDRAGMHRYLKDWLLSHIVTADMQYRRFVEERNQRSKQSTL
jgi:hemerythrin-like metal-binding protein/PAS domain S-box-containing protein